jgi:hypothetical protein
VVKRWREGRPGSDSHSYPIEEARGFFENWLASIDPAKAQRRPLSFAEWFSVERSWIPDLDQVVLLTGAGMEQTECSAVPGMEVTEGCRAGLRRGVRW